MRDANAWLVLDKKRVIVNPDGGVHLGEIPVNIPPRLPTTVPAAILSVSTKQWAISKSIIDACRNQKILPVIHVWKRQDATPEFAIAFVVPKPDHEFLCKLMPRNKVEVRSQSWDELKLLFTVRIEREYVERFCAAYYRMKKFAVIITGKEPGRIGNVDLGTLDKRTHFLCDTLVEGKPQIILD